MNRAIALFALTLLTLQSGCMGSHNRPVQLISGAGPIYPAAAKAAGTEGQVVVRYDISDTGRVLNARVESADPPDVFDEAALAAVRSWKYNPQIRDGEPQMLRNVLSTVHFKIGRGDEYDGY